MSQAAATFLGVLGLLVLTLLLGTGFGADMDFSLRRSHPVPSFVTDKAPAGHTQQTDPASQRSQ